MIDQFANPSGPQSNITEYGQELLGIRSTDSGKGLCVTQKHMWDTESKLFPPKRHMVNTRQSLPL